MLLTTRRSALFPLLLLAVVHAVVDAVALFVQPLWPDLQHGLSLDDGTIQSSYFAWNLAASVPQLLFGYWGDRYRLHWLVWGGPVVGIACISSLGFVDSLVGLNLLLLVGGLGIAAFHPEAAAMAGNLYPENRSRAMSVFAVGGYVGQAVGPLYSGMITTQFEMPALVWSIIWGWAGLLLLLPVGRHARTAGSIAGVASRLSLADLTRGRRTAVLLLVAIGVLRAMPALGVPLALAYSIKGHGGSNKDIGWVQSAFLFGIGLGGLGCATLVRRGHEGLVLWLVPLFVVPLLLVCPMVQGIPLMACVGATGVFLGGALPVLISYGQQLLPEGQRVASSITMGLTWGVGSGVVALTMTVVNHLQQPELAIYLFAAGTVVSSGLCAWLPTPRGSQG